MLRFVVVALYVTSVLGNLAGLGLSSAVANVVEIEVTHSHDIHEHDEAEHSKSHESDSDHNHEHATHTHGISIPVASAISPAHTIDFDLSREVGQIRLIGAGDLKPKDRYLDSIFRPPIQA